MAQSGLILKVAVVYLGAVEAQQRIAKKLLTNKHNADTCISPLAEDQTTACNCDEKFKG
ncbi:hypothetical protein ABVT39_024525 [Epinephelus coioides]